MLAVSLLMQANQFSAKYEEFITALKEFDNAVANLPNKGLIVIAILLIYLAKSVIPIPTFAVCVIAGMVFNTPAAITINIIGFIGLITVKYAWGKHLGRGIIYKLLCRYENVQRALESGSSARDVLLVGFRIVPIVPINTVSQTYGAMEFNFARYTVLSVLGFLPRIISYSIVGHNYFNPFSLAFLLPLVVMFELTGAAIIGINAAIEFYYNKKIKSQGV